MYDQERKTFLRRFVQLDDITYNSVFSSKTISLLGNLKIYFMG
jgi:hypothetical protein